MLAVGLHVVILLGGVILAGFSESAPEPPKRPPIVNAKVVDVSDTIIGKREAEKQRAAQAAAKAEQEAQQKAQQQAKRQAELEQQRRQAQAEKQRQETARLYWPVRSTASHFSNGCSRDCRGAYCDGNWSCCCHSCGGRLQPIFI